MKSKFAEQLTQFRKQKGFSQNELAKKLKISRQSVSKWENGTAIPDLDRVIEIADLLQVSLDELILGKESKVNSNKLDHLDKRLADLEEIEKNSHIYLVSNRIINHLKRRWWIWVILLIVYTLFSYYLIMFLKYLF